jgi:acyl-coenzyme A synthetase/AMP-(fatty) acid ligase
MVKLLNISDKHLINELKKLADKEIIHVLPLDINAMNLQAFHSAQSPTEKASNHTLFNLRVLSRDSFQQQPILVNSTDASELQNEDVSYLIQELQKRLQKAAIDEGDKIVIVSKPHFEALLTFWGASEMGIEVCILSTEIPTKIKQKLIKSIIPELVLTDTKIYHELVSELTDIRVLAFDDEDFTGSDENLFSNWLEEDGNLSDSKASWIPTPNSIAATLFTSGTTGMPKGIQLSHGALYRSGELLSRTYGWRSNDRLLMVAELDSMSGLRNTCVATQFTGTTVIIPDFKNDQHIFSIVESIKGNQVTLLTSTPALIKQLIQLGKRIKNDLRSLRQVICTGGNLSVSAVEEFRNLFGIKIINYYGLTETTGLCIGELENAPNDVLGSIGVAVDAIAQVVDNNLKLLEPGEIGKLRIYNDRLMSGYLNPDDETNLQIENGWLYTGDWAVQDEHGNFFLKGRERDIIKDQAGNIVYLIEVEQCLTSHNKVKDVAICGEQNDANEYLIAFIIIHDDFMNEKEVLENELKEYVGSEIGSNKTPSKIIFKDEFQSNSRGKVDKKTLINSLKTTVNIND